MSAKLHLVSPRDVSSICPETLVDEAASVEPHRPIEETVAAAEDLAARTVRAIRHFGEPGVLASVALSISDQARRVAFLEGVAKALI